MKTYIYKGVLPPTLFVSNIDNKKYIVPAWIEVEPNTTIEQVKWIKPFLNQENNDTN